MHNVVQEKDWGKVLGGTADGGFAPPLDRVYRQYDTSTLSFREVVDIQAEIKRTTTYHQQTTLDNEAYVPIVSEIERDAVGKGIALFRGISRRNEYIVHVPFLALFSFVGCAISVGLMAMTALLTHNPFVFPSLGPTAFLFFSSPGAPPASPRNTIIGHTIGVLAGYLSLAVTGLTLAGPALQVGVTGPRIIAVALSLSLTAGLMILLHASHPPAGATTLIVSLGILAKPWQLGVLMLAVVLLTLSAILINRLAGIPYPLWMTVSREGFKERTKGKIQEETGRGQEIHKDGNKGSAVIFSQKYLPQRSSQDLLIPDTNLRPNKQFLKRETRERCRIPCVILVPLNAD